MKQNLKLLEKLDEFPAECLIEDAQIGNLYIEQRKDVPSSECNKAQKISFIENKYQKLLKQQSDLLSLESQNFDQEQNRNSILKSFQVIQPIKKQLGQNFLTKHKLTTNRIISAQPIRPLLIKKGSDLSSSQQFESYEQKKSIFIFKNLADRKIQYQENEIDSSNQQLNSNQINPIFKRVSRLRRKSQTYRSDFDQIIDQPESQVDSELYKSLQGKEMISKHEKKDIIEQYNSFDQETIELITKKKESEFDQITKIEFRFNATSGSLFMIGELLINLQELTLDFSNVESLRLLGTKLKILQILSIRKSNLSDLSGVLSMPNLEELNCSLNNIRDLSPLSFHAKIAILNLEANQLTDEDQIDHLESLNLKYLNIKMNPLSQNKKIDEFIQRFPSVSIERDLDINTYDNFQEEQQLKQNSRVQIKQSKINLEVQKIKQLEILLDDLEKQKEVQLVKGKLQKNKLKRPQTAQARQLELSQMPHDQKFDQSNLMKNIESKDSQIKSKRSFD